ncbi:MAG: hypothetical protein WC097_01580 [Eubacteriales bacterium]
MKSSNIETPTAQEKAQNGANLSPQGQAVDGIALIKLNREQEDRQRNLEMYRDYQNNIRISGELQTELLKGARAGEPAYTLLLKACKAISLMTGNKPFYSQIYKDLKAIYGEGLKEQIPLEWELDEVRERLANMEEAIKRENTGTDSRERIAKAIEAHRERERELLELIGKEEVKKAM